MWRRARWGQPQCPCYPLGYAKGARWWEVENLEQEPNRVVPLPLEEQQTDKCPFFCCLHVPAAGSSPTSHCKRPLIHLPLPSCPLCPLLALPWLRGLC